MLYRQFYSELGKLLYAVSDVDGMISKKEKTAIKEMVNRELVPHERHKDEFGTDAAYYTEIEFDYLCESVTDPADAFDSFIDFIEDHKTAIDKKLLIASSKVATKIADAYHHTNKKEKVLLEKLNKKLDKLIKEKG